MLRNSLYLQQFLAFHGRDATLWRKRCEAGTEEMQRCSGRDATGRGKVRHFRPCESKTYLENGRDATPSSALEISPDFSRSWLGPMP